MKWITNDVTFVRGNLIPCIAKFDNSEYWFSYDAVCSTSTFKQEVRKLAKEYGANEIEIKHLHNSEGKQVETNVIDFFKSDSGYVFRTEMPVKNGEKREFVRYTAEQLFI